MSKLFLFFLCLAVCHLAHSFPAQEPEDDFERVEDDSSIEDEARAFWDEMFNLLKKSLKIEGMKCQGASCETCVVVFGKGGCVAISYNSQPGINAAIQAKLTSGGKQLWAGTLNAGKSVPACVTLPGPIKEVCIQDFQATVGNGGNPEGDLCFTINFKSYSLGVKQCATWKGKSLHASRPAIIETA